VPVPKRYAGPKRRTRPASGVRRRRGPAVVRGKVLPNGVRPGVLVGNAHVLPPPPGSPLCGPPEMDALDRARFRIANDRRGVPTCQHGTRIEGDRAGLR
jgi:hypothetical protein